MVRFQTRKSGNPKIRQFLYLATVLPPTTVRSTLAPKIFSRATEVMSIVHTSRVHEHTGGQRAFVFFGKFGEGRTRGVGGDGLFQGDSSVSARDSIPFFPSSLL